MESGVDGLVSSRKGRAGMLSLSSAPRVGVALGAIAVSATAIFVDLSGAQPGTASFYRCLLALPLLAPAALLEARRERRLTRGEMATATLAGVLFAGDMVLWTQAIFDVGAGISTVIVNVQVIIVPLLAWAIDRESLSRWFVVTLPIMIVGVVLAGGVIDHGTLGTHAVRGTVEAVIAAFCYSGFLFIIRRSGKQTPVLQSYWLVIAAAAVCSCALGALWHGLTLDPPLAALGWLALSALCGQVLGWLLVARATPKLDSQSASVLLLLTPVGSLLLAAVFLSQSPTALQLAGSLVVLGCAALIARQAQRSERG